MLAFTRHRWSRRVRLPIFTVLLLSLASLAQPSAGSVGEGMNEAVGYELGGGPGQVRAYWTPHRMRTARSLDLLEPSGAPQATAAYWPGGPATTRPASGPTEARRSSKATAVFGSRSGAPIPYTRTEIADPSAFPYRTNGRLFGVDGNGVAYACSATVVSSQSRSVVWTAGHCVYLAQDGGLSSFIEFVPGYQNGNAPFGEWPALETWLPQPWVASESPSFDMGALVVATDQNGMRLEDLVGGRGIAWNVARNLQFDAFGYPAAPPFDGERLFVCDSAYGLEDPFGFTDIPRTTAIGCDMTEGSSGGGWIIRDQYLNGVNSYGFDEVPEVMFGPYFGEAAALLFGAASASQAPGPLPAEPAPAPLVGQLHALGLSLRTVGHLRVKGQMSATDGYLECTRGAPVGIFRISRGEIFLMKVVTTDGGGSYSAKVRDLEGRYVAFSPEGYVDDLNVCTEVRSPGKRHKHRR